MRGFIRRMFMRGPADSEPMSDYDAAVESALTDSELFIHIMSMDNGYLVRFMDRHDRNTMYFCATMPEVSELLIKKNAVRQMNKKGASICYPNNTAGTP